MGLFGAIASIAGGLLGKSSADKANATNVDLAKNSIYYKVKDAQRAGVHPLYAVGAPTMQVNHMADPMGDAVSNAGKAVDNAVSSNYEKQLQAKNLESIQADIDLKKAQSMGYIAEAKKASNLGRAVQTGRTAGNANSLKTASGGKLDVTGLTPADEFEQWFGSAGENYGVENLYHSLKKQAPKALDSLKARFQKEKPSRFRQIKKNRYKKDFNPYWWR
jgi:hypothetical protein